MRALLLFNKVKPILDAYRYRQKKHYFRTDQVTHNV